MTGITKIDPNQNYLGCIQRTDSPKNGETKTTEQQSKISQLDQPKTSKFSKGGVVFDLGLIIGGAIYGIAFFPILHGVAVGAGLVLVAAGTADLARRVFSK